MHLNGDTKRPVILLVESDVQAIDYVRRAGLEERFIFRHYNCASTDEFIAELRSGKHADTRAILRMGWLRSGPYSTHDLFKAEVIRYFPESLRLVCCCGHGYDYVDVEALTQRHIWFCNTPNACTEAVANTGLYLVLETFRYLTYSQWCARNDWKASRSLGLKAVDPYERVLGVVGFGDIGLTIALKCEAAFSMRIHYYGPNRKTASEKLLKRGATYHESLQSLIKTADCLVIAAPYTKETHHLLSTKEFRMAKSSGIRIVNIARGKMVDEKALIEAIDDGHVVGAGLDVHEYEPQISSRLSSNWMVTLLPHIGVCSGMSWANFEKQNLDNLEAFFATGRPISPVNRL